MLPDGLLYFLQEHPDGPAHLEDPHAGMHPATYALVLGTLSGISLPLGAWLGIVFSPVAEKTTGMMMAFGAGALLFAVTVELYGHALKEVDSGKIGLIEMFTTIGGALAGAALYLVINRWLEEHLKADTGTLEDYSSEDEETASPTAARETDSLASAMEKQENKSKTNLRHSLMGPSESISTITDGEDPQASGGLIRQLSSHVNFMKKKDLKRIRGREKALRALTLGPQQRRKSKEEIQEINKAQSVAFSLFLGLLIDVFQKVSSSASYPQRAISRLCWSSPSSLRISQKLFRLRHFWFRQKWPLRRSLLCGQFCVSL